MVKRERSEPPSRTARRFAPAIETPLRACGARRRVPIGRYLFVKGENPPFHTFPRTRRQRTEFAAICFFRAQLTAAHTRWCRRQGNADLRSASRGSAKPAPTTLPPANLTACEPTHRQPRRISGSVERRSPTGIARQRETRPNDPTPRQSHGMQTHASPTAQNLGERGAPASDRHRAAARNPHRRRNTAPISRPRTHGSPTAQNHGERGAAGLRPETRGSAKPAPTTPRDANLTPANPRIANRAESRGAWSAGLRPASRGFAKPAPTTPPRASSPGWSAGLRPSSRLVSAKPAPTTPLPTLTRVPPPTARFPGC